MPLAVVAGIERTGDQKSDCIRVGEEVVVELYEAGVGCRIKPKGLQSPIYTGEEVPPSMGTPTAKELC